MFEHHTKSLGDLGVLKAQVDLYQKGFLILEPKTEHAPFDLVVYKHGDFKRVQVKARTLSSKGTVFIQFSSSYSTSKGSYSKEIDKDEVDIYCVYIPELDKCFYFNPKDFNKSATLRKEPTKNNQKEGINLLSNYRSF